MALPRKRGSPYRGYRAWQVFHINEGYVLGSLVCPTYWPGPIARVPEADVVYRGQGLWLYRNAATLAQAMPGEQGWYSWRLAPHVPVYGEVELLHLYVRHEHGARGSVARICRLWIPRWAAVRGAYSDNREPCFWTVNPVGVWSSPKVVSMPALDRNGPLPLRKLARHIAERYDCDVGVGE